MNKNTAIAMLMTTLIGIILPVQSQTQADNFKISSQRIVKDNNNLSISMDFDLSGMTVKTNGMTILTPVLKSNDIGGESLSLPIVTIVGGLRNKIVNRMIKLGNQDQLPFDSQPQVIVKRENNTTQSVNYSTSFPYRPWMDNASLTIEKAVSGCANCYEEGKNQLIVQNVLQKIEPSSFKLSFIMPEVEPVKGRSHRHTASFNYIVDRYELLRDYKNNKSQFDEVDRVIEEIRGNKDLKINEFTIVGYASPEGEFEHNRKLAENRANSFAHYLLTEFGISRESFTVEGKGEDWTGLYKAISDSYLSDKKEILHIIDKVDKPDARDSELIKLSNGNTYNTLLNSYYPQLRRSEYVVAYIVRAFNVEEGRLIVKTNPKLLSLNEMYLVAKSYPSKSKEFKEVFDIAVRLYPDSEIAIMNSAAADIENKNYDTAIERLKKIEDKPISWNNLGVAYALKGDVKKASIYFNKSADNGDIDGIENKKNIQENE